jgi:hypothetical protein
MGCLCRQVGSAEVLSGATGGTDHLVPGSTNDFLGEAGSPVGELSKYDSGLVKRSPGVGVSTFQPVPWTMLTAIAGWYWGCTIRGGGRHQHIDDRRCQQCAQQWWKLCFRSFEFQWRSHKPRTRACSRSELNYHCR